MYRSHSESRGMLPVPASLLKRIVPALAASLLTGGLALAQQPANLLGVWYDDTGKGAVEILPCGQGPSLCGRIVWLKEPNSTTTGLPLVDGYNPDVAKRQRPICGLQVLGDLKPQGNGVWDAGWVYDPKVGKSYDAAIEAETRNSLTLTGYKGVKFLGKSFTWTRAPATLPRCASVTGADAPSAPAASPPAAKPAAAPRSSGGERPPAPRSARSNGS